MRGRPPLSLKGRALGLLSRRDHSRLELEKKLLPHAETGEQLSELLDELVRLKFLSDDRFIESVLHRRSANRGTLMLRHELSGHGLDQDKVKAALETSKLTEFDRALALWERRFGQPAEDLAGKAKQMRFLASRGFSGDVVRRVLSRAGMNVDED
jgi:regulatory protein